MRKKINILLIFLVLLLALTGCIETKEGLVAKVEGEEITEEQLNAEYKIFEGLYIKQLGKDALLQKGEDGRTLEEVIKDQVLDKMIMERLIQIEADKMDISVSEDELNKKLDEYIVVTGGEKAFDEFLKSNSLEREFFKENLKKELLVNKHKEKFMETVEIKDKDARAFFDENKEKLEVIRASHILVKTEEEAQKILDRLEIGENFEDLAKGLSSDKASGLLGGDLGYFIRGTRLPEFEEVAFSLEKDQISDIVKTEIGYHIIKLVDRKDVYEELKDEITMVLKDEKYTEEMTRIRNKSKVKVFNE